MSARAARAVLVKRAFYQRMPDQVAPELLGKLLVRDDGRVLRILETEAYAQDDPASHAWCGPTARNASMFGLPGHMYVYFSYGVHWCANLVCGPEGYGAGVLLRAGEPLSGIGTMQMARKGVALKQLCNGPGKLAQAMGIDRSFDGVDVTRHGVLKVQDDGWRPEAVAVGPRIGISKAVEAPLRFWVAGHAGVSRRG